MFGYCDINNDICLTKIKNAVSCKKKENDKAKYKVWLQNLLNNAVRPQFCTDLSPGLVCICFQLSANAYINFPFNLRIKKRFIFKKNIIIFSYSATSYVRRSVISYPKSLLDNRKPYPKTVQDIRKNFIGYESSLNKSLHQTSFWYPVFQI